MKIALLCSTAILFIAVESKAQMIVDPSKPLTNKPEETEIFAPQAPLPKVVKPGKTFDIAPSDAIVLFDGKSLDEWVSTRGKTPAKWVLTDGVMTVNKQAGDIETK